jgi:hypothetical protein
MRRKTAKNRRYIEPYSLVCPAALALAHLARAAAASLALTAGLLRRSPFFAGFGVTVAPLSLAHLAFAPAMMAALPAALNRLLPFFAGLAAWRPFPLTLAHLALAPAAILARPPAEIRRRLAFNWIGISPPSPAMDVISPWSVSICSLIAMMRLS